jgi:hypothetical protein
VRVLRTHLRRSRRSAVVAIALFSLSLIGAAAIVYLRNWVLFKNPLYPFAFSVRALDLSFSGPWSMADIAAMRAPFSETYLAALSAPVPGKDFYDTRVHGYGIAIPFLLVPLSAIGACIAVARTIGRAHWPARCKEAAGLAGSERLVVALAAYATLMAVFSPGLQYARYNVHVALIVMLVVHWMGRIASFRRFSESLAITSIVTGLAMHGWAEPGWNVPWRTMISLWRSTPAERAASQLSEWTMPSKVAAARETEIGPGDVVAFGDDVEFPALLWNERHSNRVVYVPYAPSYRIALNAAGAKWTVTGNEQIARELLTSGKWQLVGSASNAGKTNAYRRIR